jgi:flotillin
MEEIIFTLLYAGTGAIVALIGVITAFVFAKQFLRVCRPNQLLLVSGASGANTGGYQVVDSGRKLCFPVIHQVTTMDLTTLPVEVHVTNAYAKGGIALELSAVANVKISSDHRIRKNAIERFLGQDRSEIHRVAKETLEGHVRGVVATLTPEQVNEDRLRFAEALTLEASLDLDKLGLQLDTLKIQRVSDDQEYLSSIGRELIAAILRDAEIAESDAKNNADQHVARCDALAEVAEAEANTAMAKRRNELRSVKAELQSDIRSAEERAISGGERARMQAQLQLQEVRSSLEELRLHASEVLPSIAAREAAELNAEGEAANIREEGNAMKVMLEEISQAWAAAGPDAANMLLIRQLDKVLARVSEAVSTVEVRETVLVDGGEGSALPAYVASYPAMVTSVLDEVRRAVGIDVVGSMAKIANPKEVS